MPFHSIVKCMSCLLLCCLLQSKVMAADKQADTVQIWSRLRLWLDLVQQVSSFPDIHASCCQPPACDVLFGGVTLLSNAGGKANSPIVLCTCVGR